MANKTLIGGYPVIGIRPVIDGRGGALKLRDSLEDQTMGMAKAAKKLEGPVYKIFSKAAKRFVKF